MPVTAGRRDVEISQRGQYAKGGVGRRYWDYRDEVAFRHIVGTRILDAGCGEGVTLEKLLRRMPDARIEGVDVDEANIAICHEHGLPVHRADLNALPYPDSSFDTCLLMEVIEHLDQPETALAELARVTRPGGRILVIYPVDWAMRLARVVCLRWMEARFDPGHLRQWTRRGLGRLMRSCGIAPIRHVCLPFWPPFMLHGLVVGERTES